MLKSEPSASKLGEGTDLPNNHNDEIQHVPAVPHVCILVHHQTISNNLQEGLYCENDQEGIFNCFLQTHKRKKLRAVNEHGNTYTHSRILFL